MLWVKINEAAHDGFPRHGVLRKEQDVQVDGIAAARTVAFHRRNAIHDGAAVYQRDSGFAYQRLSSSGHDVIDSLQAVSDFLSDSSRAMARLNTSYGCAPTMTYLSFKM